MAEEQPAQQSLVQLADRLRQVSAEPDLGATLEVAGDVLEGGDAATAARMLLDRADAELGEGTWQEMVSALLAEQQAQGDGPAGADQGDDASSADVADRRPDSLRGDAPTSTPSDAEGALAPDEGTPAPGAGSAVGSASNADAPNRDTAADDPLAAALRDFADELASAASDRARGDLDAREALARLKAGFHATRRTLAAVQREELRSRLARAR